MTAAARRQAPHVTLWRQSSRPASLVHQKALPTSICWVGGVLLCITGCLLLCRRSVQRPYRSLRAPPVHTLWLLLTGPGGASPTDLRPLRLAFDQAASPDLLPSPPLPAAAAAPTAVVVAADLAAAEPGSSDAAAVARCLDASTAIPLAVEASSPPREPPAAGEPPGTLAGPAAGAPAADSRPSTAPQQPAALDTPAAAAPAVHVAVERPTTASSRAQALLRLKQRRLQQHLHEQQPGGGGASSTAVMPGSVQLGLPDAANAAAAADAVTSHPAPQQLAIHVEAASTVSGEHAEQGPAQQQQDQGGEQPARQPKPFLRRRSQMIPMQASALHYAAPVAPYVCGWCSILVCSMFGASLSMLLLSAAVFLSHAAEATRLRRGEASHKLPLGPASQQRQRHAWWQLVRHTGRLPGRHSSVATDCAAGAAAAARRQACQQPNCGHRRWPKGKQPAGRGLPWHCRQHAWRFWSLK